MKILVTGCSGFIGKNLLEQLIPDVGVDIVQLPKKLKKSILVFKKEDFVNTDLNDIDIVIHLASFIDVQESKMYPDKYWENNFIKTKQFIDLCEKRGIKKFIFTSSASVYQSSKNKHKENEELSEDNNMYARSKIACEKYLIQSKLNWVILRLSNVYGKYNDKGVIYQFSKGLKHGTIIMNNFGESVRDFVHVYDVVEAIKKSFNINKKIINISSGKGISINNLLTLIMNLNRKMKVNLEITTFEEENYNILNNTKMRTILKIKPKTLKEGLKNVLEQD